MPQKPLVLEMIQDFLDQFDLVLLPGYRVLYRLNQLCISIDSENIIPCGDQIYVSLTAGPKLLTYPWMLAIDSSLELPVRS